MNQAIDLSSTGLISLPSILASVSHKLSQSDLTFKEFIVEAWPILEPATPFIDNYHIDIIAEHLEAVTERVINRLIINVPPRYMKSSLATIFWPCWEWSFRPWERYIFGSHAQTLSTKHSVDRRLLIESPWYQERWGAQVQLSSDQNEKTQFSNTRRGHMVATSIGGSITGKGGGRVVVDDPQDPQKSESLVERENVNNVWDKSLRTRLDNKNLGAYVIVMHRLHQNDLCGHVIKRQPKVWTVLNLVGMPSKKLIYKSPLTKTTWTHKSNEPLWPARENKKQHADQREAMGERSYSAQYDGDPKSATGNMIKRKWIQRYKELPKVLFRAWSWDTAHKIGQSNAWTVGGLWAECMLGWYLEMLVRVKAEFPEQKKLAEDWYKSNPSDVVLIEDKASGIGLTQEFQRSNKMPVKPVPVDTDKATRLILVSPLFESGKVFVAEDNNWAAKYIEEICSFPNSEFNDQVDMTSQALTYLKNRPKKIVLTLGGK